MYRHAVIIHMSYMSKKRLAFHIVFKDSSVVKHINKNLTEKFQHLRFGFHVIQTQSDSIESIAKKDPYFEGIKYYTDFNQFVDTVESDIQMNVTDAVKVILSENSFTPLCLQNITFSSYVQYFKQSKQSLFHEKFEAWKHGPVIPELYQSLKPYQKNDVSKLDNYEKKVLHSRFLQIPNGVEIQKLIKNISNENSKLTTTSIYNEGHVENGPWALTYHNKVKGPSHKISNDDIKNYVQRI